MKLDTILVPTDFSERANTALTHACDLAKLSGAALHVLHVLEWHANPTPSFGLGLALPTWVQESKTAAEHTLQQLIGKLCPDGQKVVPALLAGTPAKAVLSYATEHKTDLIVMTTPRPDGPGARSDGKRRRVSAPNGSLSSARRPDGVDQGGAMRCGEGKTRVGDRAPPS